MDSYEKEQQRLLNIYESLSSDEEVHDPFSDTEGQYGSDEDYDPANEKSDSDDSEDMVHQSPATPLEEEIESENDESDHEELLVDTKDEWEQTNLDIPEFSFDKNSVGLKIPLKDNTSPIDMFQNLFTDEILDLIVSSTNEYGKSLSLTNRPLTRHSRRQTFRETNADEMRQFLGLCLLNGQISSPSLRKMFTYSDPLYFHLVFTHVMSGRRFEQILRCISAAGSQNLDKVKPLMDAQMRIFQSTYSPDEELSLDESLLLFRGRLHFRQYIKGKKAKYGIKVYELATSDGYLLNMEIYSGKNQTQDITSSKTEQLVFRLMQPYLMKGHTLFMDNYYNSVTLSEKLLNSRTHSVGTLRSNRKRNPKEVTGKKLKKGEHFWVDLLKI
ncbi:hypothetical protein JTB14_033651 [Gonioctena quinquepunctata]|nr:hypothetical protein JTB14_033651 [Gonioctena quinquepunctata]